MKHLLLLLLTIVTFTSAGVVWEYQTDNFSQTDLNTYGQPIVCSDFTMVGEYVGDYDTDFIIANNTNCRIGWLQNKLSVLFYDNRTGTSNITYIEWDMNLNNGDTLKYLFSVNSSNDNISLYVNGVKYTGSWINYSLGGLYKYTTVGYSGYNSPTNRGLIAKFGSVFNGLKLYDHVFTDLEVETYFTDGSNLVWEYQTNINGVDTTTISKSCQNFTLTGTYVKEGATVYLKDKNLYLELSENSIFLKYFTDRNGTGYYKEKQIDISTIVEDTVRFLLSVDSANNMDIYVNSVKQNINFLFDGNYSQPSNNYVYVQNWTNGISLNISLYKCILDRMQINEFFGITNRLWEGEIASYTASSVKDTIDTIFVGVEDYTMACEYIGTFTDRTILFNTPAGQICWNDIDSNLIFSVYKNRNGTGAVDNYVVYPEGINTDGSIDTISIVFGADSLDNAFLCINNELVSLGEKTSVSVSGNYNHITLGTGEDLNGNFPVTYSQEGSVYKKARFYDKILGIKEATEYFAE